jgi:hypothetical protein
VAWAQSGLQTRAYDVLMWSSTTLDLGQFTPDSGRDRVSGGLLAGRWHSANAGGSDLTVVLTATATCAGLPSHPEGVVTRDQTAVYVRRASELPV